MWLAVPSMDEVLTVISSLICPTPLIPFTTSGTTAKPLPCSPALAASIVAFNKNILVCSDTPLIMLTKSLIPAMTVLS